MILILMRLECVILYEGKVKHEKEEWSWEYKNASLFCFVFSRVRLPSPKESPSLALRKPTLMFAQHSQGHRDHIRNALYSFYLHKHIYSHFSNISSPAVLNYNFMLLKCACHNSL